MTIPTPQQRQAFALADDLAKAKARRPVLAPRHVLLVRRLGQANVAADEAIATYNSRKAALQSRHHGSPSAFDNACRDDKDLQDASRAEGFNTRLANRLALTLLVELQLGRFAMPAANDGD